MSSPDTLRPSLIDTLIYIPRHGSGAADIGVIGGKAHSLARVAAAGHTVPPFFVVTTAALRSVAGDELDGSEPIASGAFPPELLAAIDSALECTGLRDAMLAVRSSAVGEDSGELSYAGQLETRLFVRPAGLVDAIRDVWSSAFTARVGEYRRTHDVLGRFAGVGVIVQRMIDADVSGVSFGIDPVSGDRDAVVVSAVLGLGEGLVGGELDADTFVVRTSGIERRIVDKRQRIVFDRERGVGTVTDDVPADLQGRPALDDDRIGEIVAATRALGRLYGRPQDVEWAIAGSTLFILQSRPVTGLRHIPPDRRGRRVLWDNSNIIESYAGITTPLTFSFVNDVYTVVYQEFCRILGVDETTIERNTSTFQMLGLIEGRIYYNLLNWYRMLALLPGYRINARFMEQMMGVSERLEQTPDVVASTRNPWLSLVVSVNRLVANLRSLPRQITAFQRHLDATLAPYETRDLSGMLPHELIATYRLLERELLRRWRVPILNDFYTMIFFGGLKKIVEGTGSMTLHNDLLSGEGGIISTEPPRRLQQIVDAIRARDGLADRFAAEDPSHLLDEIESYPDVAALVREYLARFGNRYPGELKLETITPAMRPELLIEQLAAILRQSSGSLVSDGASAERTRRDAERTVERALRPLKRPLYRYVLRQARERVRNRENLRFERTRVFAVVRRIFIAIGGHLHAEGIIDEPRDVFFLTKEEIFAWIEGTAVTIDLRALVTLRRAEHERQALARPADRFETWGMIYQGNTFGAGREPGAIVDENALAGTPCSAGVVRAQVRVVRDPSKAPALDGAILVAERTDPGWVPLFAAASGLLVERGSLLSHSAIVAREMGIPAIVGIPGLMDRLVDGEVVEMDGSTGIVTRLAAAAPAA